MNVLLFEQFSKTSFVVFLTEIAEPPKVAKMLSAERRELRGTVLDGRYRIQAPIGLGGTAVVFAGVRISDQFPIVVKVLRPSFAHNTELMSRLQREAEVARTIAHPGIVRILGDGWLDDGSPYLVLERIRGRCLAQILKDQGRLSPEMVAAIIIRASAILHAAHVHGYVHRDMKPEHIMLTRTSDGWLDVRCLDFGVCSSARASAEELDSERGRVYGTPSYASPEQAAGRPEVDARTDVFGLGIVMFEALTGQMPFNAPNISQLLRKIIRTEAPSVHTMAPELDPELAQVIGRALARNPSKRFPSARAFARTLLPFVGDRRKVERGLANLVNLTYPNANTVPTRVAAPNGDVAA